MKTTAHSRLPMKRLFLTGVAALFLATGTAWAQSGDPRSSAYGGASGVFGPGTGSVNTNRHPGYACPINMKCDGRKAVRPLDPNAPLYRPVYTPQQLRARKLLEAIR
jgi:hypothetical protein